MQDDCLALECYFSSPWNTGSMWYVASQSLREEDLSAWKQVQPNSSHPAMPEEGGGNLFDTRLFHTASALPLCSGPCARGHR